MPNSSSAEESSSVASSNLEHRSSAQSSSGVSSSTEDVSTSHHSSNTGNRSVPEEIAAKETSNVRRYRAIFVLILLAFAISAATITYVFTSNSEDKSFDTQFHDFAFEIEDVAHHNAHNMYGSVHGFAATVTSFAEFGGIVYPDLTLPHFDIRAQNLMETAGADFVALSPVVNESNHTEWVRYAAANHAWIAESLGTPGQPLDADIPLSIHDEAGIEVGEGDFVFDEELYHVPAWQMSPLSKDALHVINYDLLTHPVFHRIFYYIETTKEPVLSEVINVTSLFGANAPIFDGHPQSLLVQPIFRGFGDTEVDREVVAVLTVILPWDLFFTNLLHEGAGGIVIVLEDTCGDVFTYKVDGPNAHYIGEGDLHDSKYNDMEYITEFEPFGWHEELDDLSDINCHYYWKMYPSRQLEDEYKTKKPVVLTLGVLLVFILTTAAFATYDCFVQKRQEKVVDSAMRSNAIVSSLFPADVRDRLFRHSRKHKKSKKGDKKKGALLPTLTEAPKFRLSNFLSDDSVGAKADPMEEVESKPIADLFPNCTVMFADIQGFTAWSSVREPSQVFTLLETLYRGFDRIAKRRRVFKVETIGDCYVAVAGLPEPRDDHAVVMARFAKECLKKMKSVTTSLEVALGPDTGDLQIRVGLNSGPVTAGVLRGEKSRFQLFGDTVNTAARVEATGSANRIHMSEDTAKELRKAGKANWFEARPDSIWAKGKGDMQTFWLAAKLPKGDGSGDPGNDPNAHDNDSDSDNVDRHTTLPIDGLPEGDEGEQKRLRMIGWNVDVLLRILKQVVASRHASSDESNYEAESVAKLESVIGGARSIQSEVTEFVKLPSFDIEKAESMGDPESVVLKPNVEDQLRLLVTDLSTMYRDNPFHNFEHASHVTMSVNKLLGRIVTHDVAPGEKEHGQGSILSRLHDQTYGITSDPLTQFAVVFTALIHDIDHAGVPNFILAKEEPEMASMYNDRSLAEQHSFHLAWERLMEPDLADLRACIYTTTEELERFHQTAVNTIMATDIFDKGFAELRKKRWDSCFHSSETPATPDGAMDVINRKATIVVEHVIQASDVSHTMQHWHIYQRWNERLFQEMYTAFQTGRTENDPSLNWYESEIGFFDNYVIPLAKKLKECGVFGVSSDEYLNYANQNREEWSSRGKSIVEDCVTRLKNQDRQDHC